jgi:hypothetical protein
MHTNSTMKSSYPDVYLAIPVLNESANLFGLLKNIAQQDYPGRIKVFICGNQPDEWWSLQDKISICRDNRQSLDYLRKQNTLEITAIDRSSPGLGWTGRKHGVGFARKEIMDAIAAEANATDVLISLDADTSFKPAYVSSVVETLEKHAHCEALAVPYYHRLADDETANRAILRYEIYMRCYALNLLRIQSPFAFTALGSAIALWAKNYKTIGGMTPKMSGEDFYFLQKLRKKGHVIVWNPEKVYPQARFSERVYFGTGPAMIKGSRGDWSSYPVYNFKWFDEVLQTYETFPLLFNSTLQTPLDEFLAEVFPGEAIWDKLRKNSASVKKFVQACHQKVDGLRVLQFLKWKHGRHPQSDEQNLVNFITFFCREGLLEIPELRLAGFSFEKAEIPVLSSIRDFLAAEEEKLQRSRMIV